MTGQITDTYRYKGRNYSIIALTNPIDFRPEEYGFTPEAPHTACWRGYFCLYDITDEHLFLSKLWICNGDNPYPKLDGISPVLDKREDMMVYKDLQHQIDYDGRIVCWKWISTRILYSYGVSTGLGIQECI